MTAREYLTQARMIDSRINSKLMELQRARELATKATCLVSDMPRNPSPDLQQMESRIVKIVDLEREINAEIDELVDLKRDIRQRYPSGADGCGCRSRRGKGTCRTRRAL